MDDTSAPIRAIIQAEFGVDFGERLIVLSTEHCHDEAGKFVNSESSGLTALSLEEDIMAYDTNGNPDKTGTE